METNEQDSILLSVKKLLGIDKDYTQFDTDIIMHINSAFSTLNELGAGPEDGFEILDKNELWENFTDDNKLLNIVKTYVYKKVRLVFDPPSSSWVADSITKMISEDEFRIQVITDVKKEEIGS